jgi:hypothetical protein
LHFAGTLNSRYQPSRLRGSNGLNRQELEYEHRRRN